MPAKDYTQLLVDLGKEVAATRQASLDTQRYLREAMQTLSETVSQRFDDKDKRLAEQSQRLDGQDGRLRIVENWQSNFAGRMIVFGVLGVSSVGVFVGILLPALLAAVGVKTP